jgi:hypothetical protein
MIVLGSARDADARSRRVLSDMRGSIIDDTTAIGKRLNELTSKHVAVKTATPPPRRLPVCLRCDGTG